MIKPNFIICGSSASGTSFLTTGMIDHPEIYLPKKIRPEPHYFYKSWEFQKSFKEYYLKKYFSNVKNEIAIGERSSSYMFGDKVPSRMQKVLPSAKLIFILRNPIERAYANYRYTVLEGLEPHSFSYSLKNENERIKNQKGIWSEIQPYNYTGRGLYFNQLKNFLKFYPREQMLILKSESFGKNIQNDFIEVFNFLNVSTNFIVRRPPKFSSLNVIDPSLQVRLREYFKVKFDNIVEAIRKNEDTDKYLETKKDYENLSLMIENLKSKKLDMNQEDRSYLQSFYKEDIEKLQQLVAFDLSDWK